MSIPDVTLTTACFDLSHIHQYCRGNADIMNQFVPVLSIPCYMVIYTDDKLVDMIRIIRKHLQLSHLTRFVITDIENLAFYKYVDIIKSNRELYWPTRDQRTCAESHMICCNKFNFVLDTIKENPFQTTKFGWIDAFVSTNFQKVCEDYSVLKMLDILNNCYEKFHLQVMGATEKRFKQREYKREYYGCYRFLMSGCLFITPKDIGIRILTRLNELFVETTRAGYGHAEEMLYLEVLDEFTEDIHKSYGDYGQLLNNFFYPTKNLDYIYQFIIESNMMYKNYKESYDCCKAVLYSIEKKGVSCSPCLYMCCLSAYFKSSLELPDVDSSHIVEHIHSIYRTNKDIRDDINRNYDAYMTLFRKAKGNVEFVWYNNIIIYE